MKIDVFLRAIQNSDSKTARDLTIKFLEYHVERAVSKRRERMSEYRRQIRKSKQNRKKKEFQEVLSCMVDLCLVKRSELKR